MEIPMATLGRAVAEAYDNHDTQGGVLEEVMNKFPNADANVVWGMWFAADETADIFMSQEPELNS